jgi:starch phosphorylase
MKAEKQNQSVTATSMESEMAKLMEQYGSGPVQFTKADDALYERHLVFDNVMEETRIGARERFEAIARSVRDVLSQRWVHTETTYRRENAKRVYYLSMEFLLGRSLANNVTNLLLDPIVNEVLERENLDWYDCWSRRRGWVMAASGAWRCLDSMATVIGQVMACATNTASSNRPSGWLAAGTARQLAPSARPGKLPLDRGVGSIARSR